MTIVRVRFTPNGAPTPGEIQFQLRPDTDQRPLTVGRDVLNGTAVWEPVPVEGAEIDVPASVAGFHYVVRFKPDGQPQVNGTFLVPPNGPIDIGDLVRYDPKAGMAYEPDPNWYTHLAGVEVGFDAVQADVHTARDQARSAATNAAGEVSAALTAAVASDANRATTSANEAAIVKAALEQVFLGGTEAVNDAAVKEYVATPGTATRGAVSNFVADTIWTTAEKIGLVADGNSMRATANDAALDAFLASITEKPGSFGATVVLYLPPGMYFFRSAKTFTQRILILGGGPANTVIKRAGGASGDFLTFKAAYSGISSMTVEGGRYQNTSTPGMDGVVVDAAYFAVRDLAVHKHTGWGLTVGKAGVAIGSQFDSVQMRSNLQGGARTIAGSGSTDCQWIRFDIGYSGGVGLQFDVGGQEFSQMHIWSSGMEDPVNNSGFVINSSGNRGWVQSEKNNGYGVEVRASDNEVRGRVWGNVKAGIYGSGASRVDARSLAVYRNCVGNTTGSTSTAFGAIQVFNCTAWTMPKHVWDNANALAPSSPPGEPAPTYPYPGKPAAYTHAWASVETGTSDNNSYVGSIMLKQDTLGPSTNYPVNFTGSTGQGVNNRCEGLQTGLTDLPTQPVNANIVRPPSWTDVIKVNAASTIATIAGNRPGRVVTIIFTGSGTGSVPDSGNLRLNGNLAPTPGTVLTLVGDGTAWYEISRSVN